jgi:tetratricopeptide (TPR) repeat protein
MGEGRLSRAHELRRRAETLIASAGWLSARELLSEALTLYRDEANPAGEVACLRGLGDVAARLDEVGQADELYRQALDGARHNGDRVLEGECLYRQADLRRRQGKLDEAGELLARAASLLGEVGHHRAEAECFGLLGEIGRQRGAPPGEVLGWYRRAQARQLEVGELRGAAVTLTFMGNYLRDRDPTGAATAFVQAAEIHRGLGSEHRAAPLLLAAHKLDPSRYPAPAAPAPGPWDEET